MNRKPFDERNILQLLARGDQDAFKQLFDHYRPRIFSVALRFLKSRVLAEEVVQEVFLKIWVRRESLVQVLQFESYLFTMARNQVFDGMKDIAQETNTKLEFAQGVSHTSGADQLLIDQEYENLLREAVNQLPPQQKQIFRLAKVEGLSHQAIAEQLNISRLTVKTHMAKALQTIRQNLQHHITTSIFFPVSLRIIDQLFL